MTTSEAVFCHAWVPADPAFPLQPRAVDNDSVMRCPGSVAWITDYPGWVQRITGAALHGYLCMIHGRGALGWRAYAGDK